MIEAKKEKRGRGRGRERENMSYLGRRCTGIMRREKISRERPLSF